MYVLKWKMFALVESPEQSYSYKFLRSITQIPKVLIFYKGHNLDPRSVLGN